MERKKFLDNEFHVLGADNICIPDTLGECRKLCFMKGYHDAEVLIERDVAGEADRAYVLALKNHSSQGVAVFQYFGECPQLNIKIMRFASNGDVALAFSLMESIKTLYPQSYIVYNRNTGKAFSLTQENRELIAMVCMQNLLNLMDMIKARAYVEIEGIHRRFAVTSQEGHIGHHDWRDLLKVTNQFVDTQWNYEKL